MERLAIIDHDTHTLYIDDVSDEELAKYGYEEEDFIKDNYSLKYYSWDLITETQYFPLNSDIATIINYEEDF